MAPSVFLAVQAVDGLLLLPALRRRAILANPQVLRVFVTTKAAIWSMAHVSLIKHFGSAITMKRACQACHATVMSPMKVATCGNVAKQKMMPAGQLAGRKPKAVASVQVGAISISVMPALKTRKQ